jgi:short-subunit dehydrogenase
MKVNIGKERFGPWALITGASSGIGREFARQLARAGLSTVLAARRRALLEEVGRSVATDFGVQYRVITADFSEEGFVETLASATDDLDIGLVVSNAGSPSPGGFLSKDRNELASQLRLNALSHLDIAHHFGRKLTARGRGGLIFVSAMGAEKGIPYMANDSGGKAYVQCLAQALHVELKPVGIHVTVVSPGPTETQALALLGLTPETMPMKPMKVEQCVWEALRGLAANRSLVIPGRMNRIMNAIVPASVTRTMMAKMFEKSLAGKPAGRQTDRSATGNSIGTSS